MLVEEEMALVEDVEEEVVLVEDVEEEVVLVMDVEEEVVLVVEGKAGGPLYSFLANSEMGGFQVLTVGTAFKSRGTAIISV